MEMLIDCPSCDARLNVVEDDAGQVLACPDCGEAVRIPRAFFVPGEELGGFRVERLLGCGGMGDVFLATQLSMDRPTALKVLPPSVTDDKESLEQFLNEVRLTAKFEHPNIVTVFEAGEDSGYYYLAMSYVNGRDVEQLLTREKILDEKRAVEICLAAGKALGHVWTKGQITHRDIKPSNLMLDQSGKVRVMDMGIAGRLSDTNQTEEGFVLGTPYYMSPEQASAQKVLDYRTDVYSLGASLFHMVTGHPPFDADDPTDIMRAHIEVVAPLARSYNPNVSSGCEKLLAKMLNKNLDDRYESWDAVVEDCQRVLDGKLPAGMKETSKSKPPTSAKGKKASKKTVVKKVEPKRSRPATSPGKSSVAPAPGKSSSGPILMVVAAIAVLGILGIVLTSGGNKPQNPNPRPTNANVQTPENASPKADPLIALRNEWMATRAYGQENRRKDISTVIMRYEALMNQARGTALEDRIQRELDKHLGEREAQVNGIIADLDQQAGRFMRARDLEKAKNVYLSYSGPLKRESVEDRSIRAASLVLEEEQAEEPTVVEEVVVEPDVSFGIWFDQIAAGLRQQGLSSLTALKRLERPDPADDAERTCLSDWDDLLNVNRRVMRKFATRIGKDVSLELKEGGRSSVKIKGVENGRLVGEKKLKYGTMPVKLTLNDLVPREQVVWLRQLNTAPAQVAIGILMMQGRRAGFEKQLLSSGTELGKRLATARTSAARPAPTPTVKSATPVEPGDEAGAVEPAQLPTPPITDPISDLETLLAAVRSMNQEFPGDLGEAVSFEAGRVRLPINGIRNYTFLSQLQGVSDLTLYIDDNLLVPGGGLDLVHLKGKALTGLEVSGVALRNLGVIFAMPLQRLVLDNNKLNAVNGIRRLKPTLEHLAVRRNPLTHLDELEGFKLRTIDTTGSALRNISFVRGMPLQEIRFSGIDASTFLPLKGLRPRVLHVDDTKFTDVATVDPINLVSFSAARCKKLRNLRVLKEAPLEYVNLSGTALNDLSIVASASLSVLKINNTPIRDLDDLENTAVSVIYANGTSIKDLAPLANMSVQELHIAGTRVDDLEPLAETTMRVLDISDTKVEKLAPIRRIGLDTLRMKGMRKLANQGKVLSNIRNVEK